MSVPVNTVDNDIWNATLYDKSNSAQFRDAEDLFNRVVEKNITSADIIFEIGCGSGNITENILAKKLKHKKIYACDYEPNMVAYANKTHNDGTIEYFVQDIGLPWDKLDERLRNLEGKVDLVWSNRVIHWLNLDEQKVNAMATVARLLKPGGSVFLNISQRKDMYEFLSEEEQKEKRKVLKFETHEHQYNTWKGIIEKCGLSSVSFELRVKTWKFDTEEEYHRQFQYPVIIGFLRSIMNENLTEEEKLALDKEYHPLLLKQFNTKYGVDFMVHNDPDIKVVFNEMYEVVGTK